MSASEIYSDSVWKSSAAPEPYPYTMPDFQRLFDDCCESEYSYAASDRKGPVIDSNPNGESDVESTEADYALYQMNKALEFPETLNNMIDCTTSDKGVRAYRKNGEGISWSCNPKIGKGVFYTAYRPLLSAFFIFSCYGTNDVGHIKRKIHLKHDMMKFEYKIYMKEMNFHDKFSINCTFPSKGTQIR